MGFCVAHKGEVDTVVGARVCVVGRGEAEDARLEQTMGSWAGKGQMEPK